MSGDNDRGPHAGDAGPAAGPDGLSVPGGPGGAPTRLGHPDAAVVAVGREPVSTRAGSRAQRRYWDAVAGDYQATNGAFLGGPDGARFVWCPEGLDEADARLLGPPQAHRGTMVLEVGCGAAQCGRWLAAQGARVLALDLSLAQLRLAPRTPVAGGGSLTLLAADAGALPLPDAAVDTACSAFGALPFAVDSAGMLAEVARVLRPGGRWVFSVTHPMRWVFADDADAASLTVISSYFDRRPYVEYDADGEVDYVEPHRTVGDRVRELRAAGFELLDLVEPEWPEGHDVVWGQWSPERGSLVPGTAIFVCERR